MNRTEYRDQIRQKLQEAGHEVATGKGDGFFIRGQGFVSTAKAAQMVGAPAYVATPRQARPKALPWGDFATIAMLNAPRRQEGK